MLPNVTYIPSHSLLTKLSPQVDFLDGSLAMVAYNVKFKWDSPIMYPAYRNTFNTWCWRENPGYEPKLSRGKKPPTLNGYLQQFPAGKGLQELDVNSFSDSKSGVLRCQQLSGRICASGFIFSLVGRGSGWLLVSRHHLRKRMTRVYRSLRWQWLGNFSTYLPTEPMLSVVVVKWYLNWVWEDRRFWEEWQSM